MASNQYTTDAGIDVSFNNAPESTMSRIPINRLGSTTASARLWAFVADVAYEVVRLSVAPRSIQAGTMKVDLLVNGASILATKATATVADTPVPATFTTTRIAAGATVTVALTSDSDSVTDPSGILIIRPLLGHERLA